MKKTRCFHGAVFFLIAFFWAPLAQSSNMNFGIDINNLSVNLINVTTGQKINPNDVDTHMSVYGAAFNPFENTNAPVSSGKEYASVSYTGNWLKEISGSESYNLSSNNGGVSIKLNVDGPNPDAAFGETWASIGGCNIRLNFHAEEYARYALQISGDYAYNAKIGQEGGNSFSYFFWNLDFRMRASFPIIPLNREIFLLDDSKEIGLYNKTNLPIAPIEQNYDSGLRTGNFNYTTNPGLLIAGDYSCEFIVGNGIRGQTTPIPLWSPDPAAVPLPSAILLLGVGLGRLALYRRRKLTDKN